jgi:hypothetical protein
VKSCEEHWPEPLVRAPLAQTRLVGAVADEKKAHIVSVLTLESAKRVEQMVESLSAPEASDVGERHTV